MVLAVRILLAACVAIVVVLTTTTFADPGKVFICHFNGHVSSGGVHDYLWMVGDTDCVPDGGRVLNVACEGALHGHGVDSCSAVSN